MALLKATAWSVISRMMFRIGIAGCLAAQLFGAPAPLAGPTAEYQIKAVFLFNFAQFVQWPERAFKDSRSPMVIGVLGEDPFGPYLDALVAGEKIGERPVLVRRYRQIDEVAGCHLLFISSSESGRFDRILPRLQGMNVLTLGDGTVFNREGGMVGFVTERGKVRLRINLRAAIAAHLTISSKILTPATIVTADR